MQHGTPLQFLFRASKVQASYSRLDIVRLYCGLDCIQCAGRLQQAHFGVSNGCDCGCLHRKHSLKVLCRLQHQRTHQNCCSPQCSLLLDEPYITQSACLSLKSTQSFSRMSAYKAAAAGLRPLHPGHPARTPHSPSFAPRPAAPRARPCLSNDDTNTVSPRLMTACHQFDGKYSTSPGQMSHSSSSSASSPVRVG